MFLIVGDNCFGKLDGVRIKEDITDGLATTIAIVESNLKCNWKDPKDLLFDDMSLKINDPMHPSISSEDPQGPIVCFADGKVFRLAPSIPESTLRALITINGGEDVSREQLVLDKILIEQED